MFAGETIVGAYRLVQLIGEGGMGSVWLAHHTTIGRRVAVKMLHATFNNREDIVTRFFNEARAAAAVSDPGIVQIFDYGRLADGQAYIAMELLEGEPLDRRLQRLGCLAVADALRIVRQVASSLGAAHAAGIVHRDLKPENIYLVRDGEVASGERAKLLDFGIAKLGDRAGVKTQTNALMGTPVYMSPEQCRGAGLVDARSDIYSLGCVLFALIAGRPPFVDEGPGELIIKHVTELAPRVTAFAPHVQANIDALIARCLEKDPARRFQHGGELATAIGMLLSSISNSAIAQAAAPHASTVIASTTLGGAASEASIAVPRRRWWLGALAVVPIAIVAFALRGGEQPAETPDASVVAEAPPAPDAMPDAAIEIDSASIADAAPAMVVIRIESQPPGAQVVVDGKPRGKTPFSIERERGGEVIELRLARDGYHDHVEKIDATVNRDIAVVLKARPSVRHDADEIMTPRFGGGNQ